MQPVASQSPHNELKIRKFAYELGESGGCIPVSIVQGIVQIDNRDPP